MKQIFYTFYIFLFILTTHNVVADSAGANVAFIKNKAAQLCCNLTNNAPDNSAANMEYLLKTIDICNYGTTNYGTTPQATGQWASTDAVIQAFNMMKISDNETSYVQMNDKQFNTGILITNGSKVEMKFSQTGGYVLFYAMCDGWDGTITQANNPRWGFLKNGPWRSDYGTSLMEFGFPDTNIHTVVKQDKNLWLDGVLYQNPDIPGFSCDGTLYIGSYGDCNTNDYGFIGSVYYVKIWDTNGVLVSHLVPIRTGYTMGTQTATANSFYDIVRDIIIYECQSGGVTWGCL